MIRRIIITVVIVITLLLLPTPLAQADVVWSNDFLDRVRDELIELDRNAFIVNSETGYLTPRAEPRFGAEFFVGLGGPRRENGQRIFLTHAYFNNGQYWGIDAFDGHGGPLGWFPMNQLLVRYDRRDFNEIHESEFYEFVGEFEMGLLTDRLVTWQWPGSDLPTTIHELAEDDFEYNKDEYYIGFSPLEDVVIKNINIHFAYRDPEGREWGYVEIKAEGNFWFIGHGGFFRSTRTWNEWICLDDPNNETNIQAFFPEPPPQRWSPNESINFPAFDNTFPPKQHNVLVQRASGGSRLEAPDDGLDAIYGNTLNTYVLAIIIVTIVVVAVVTVVLIRKRKKLSSGNEN